MKLFILAFLACTSSTVMAAECSLTSGPAQTHFEFLRQGQTTNWFGKDYICVEEAKKNLGEVIRIPADSCQIIRENGRNVIVYCLGY